ncbi:MAG: DUF58 domain-containing protein [Planctomycetes bacterium]|nr:DUF58 domain-containing protein [Planctomycetota bacterium]
MALFDEATLTRLRRLRLAAGRVQRGGARGERLSKQFGAGQEFGAHRPYTVGDDLRRVDWNVYGRLGQLFLKLFEQPGQLRVLLAADDAPTMDFGAHDKWLAARRVLAAIGLIALEGSEKVLMASLGRPQPVQFDGTGEARLLQLLEEMPVRAERGSDPYLQARKGQTPLRGLFEKRGRDSVLVLVSDFQEREPLVQLLRDARRSGVRAIAISIAAEEELNPTLEGFSRLQAVGGGETKLRVDERVLQAYREEVQHYRQSVAKAVHAAGAAFIELDSADPIEPLIVDLMRAGVLG